VMHVTIRQLIEETLLNINSQNMKVRNIPVTHVTIRQLLEETLLNINSQNMKERNIPVNPMAIRKIHKEPISSNKYPFHCAKHLK
jgi:hypothetical protein